MKQLPCLFGHQPYIMVNEIKIVNIIDRYINYRLIFYTDITDIIT